MALPINYVPDPLNPYTGPPDVDFDRLDKRLRSTETKFVYVGVPDPDSGERRWWDLSGSHGGRQGLELAPKIDNLMFIPFQQLISEGPYQVGATFERVDYKKREINLAVMVGNSYAPDTSFRYRMLEHRWWRSWSEKEDGWFGVYTRTHGWRWLRVRLAEAPRTPFDLDPVAFENNFMQWDMTIVAADPYWRKRIETATWKNTAATSTPYSIITEMILSDIVPGDHVGVGTLVVPNRGTEPEWPKFMVSSPGRVWIQDGVGGPMVELPWLTTQDGQILVDTDPNARTLTSAKDPVDPLFFQILRNSQLVDFVLHDVVTSTLPVWRRFKGKGFSQQIPPRSISRLKVWHSHSTGSVSAYVHQRFKGAWG